MPHAAPQPQQPSLLPNSQRRERPRKEVREVSRQQRSVLLDSGLLWERSEKILRGLSHYYYVKQDWPTVAELTTWLFQHGKIVRNDRNLVAPRITGLIEGESIVSDRKAKTRVTVGGGVCEFLPKRRCAITTGLAHPIRIREAGSVLARFGYGGAR